MEIQSYRGNFSDIDAIGVDCIRGYTVEEKLDSKCEVMSIGVLALSESTPRLLHRCESVAYAMRVAVAIATKSHYVTINLSHTAQLMLELECQFYTSVKGKNPLEEIFEGDYDVFLGD